MKTKTIDELMKMTAKEAYHHHHLMENNARLAYSVYKIKKALEEDDATQEERN